MKQSNKNKKILIIALIGIILIAGIAMIIIKGFNFELKYQDTQSIDLYLKREFNESEIKEITDEVLQGQPVIIQKVEVYDDMVEIISTSISEEQKQSIIDKVNEKFGTEWTSEDVEIVSTPHTRGRDIIKPYIIPFVLATAIVLVYLAIRYAKLGAVKVVFKAGFIIVIAEAVLASVIAITRFPIGRLTIPMALAVYLISLWLIVGNLGDGSQMGKEGDGSQMSQ